MTDIEETPLARHVKQQHDAIRFAEVRLRNRAESFLTYSFAKCNYSKKKKKRQKREEITVDFYPLYPTAGRPRCVRPPG